ncbi:MAG: hypothetical protein DHS20C06_14020 [Hyphobacterium sp.]|nr:MAG: hypothetical protein DHS20C06_14020 [Hyphobacterium sp.]
MKYLTLTAILATMAPSVGLAQDHRFTLSDGYSYQQFDQFNAHALSGRISYDFSEFLSVEANVLTGLSGSSAISCPTGTDCSIVDPRARFRHGYGVSVAGNLPITDRFGLFARAGYAAANFKVSVGPSGDDSGLTYGVGANYFFNEEHGVRFEYNRAEMDNLGEGASWGISYVRRF